MHPSDIKIGQNEYRAYQLLELFQIGRLDLDIGKQWDESNMSMSIESILLGLIMTPIYIDASQEEKQYVIDGKKRIIALYYFLENRFRLKNLEFFEKYEGSYFKELPFSFQNKIKEALFTVYTIERGTPIDVRFSIILRIVPDLKGGFSWPFKISLMTDYSRMLLDKMIDNISYANIPSVYKEQHEYELPLLFIKHYYSLNKILDKKCNLEHVIFKLNSLPEEDGDEIIDIWRKGLEGMISLFFLINQRLYRTISKNMFLLLLSIIGKELTNNEYQKLISYPDFHSNWDSFISGEKIGIEFKKSRSYNKRLTIFKQYFLK